MHFPSLQIWKLTFILSSVIILLVSYFSENIGFYIFEMQVDQSFSQEAEDFTGKKGVIIGASMIRQGLSDPIDIENLISAKQELSTSWVKITKGGLKFEVEDFLKSDVFRTKIRAYQPDYFVFQESFFCFEKKELSNKYHPRIQFGLRTLLRKLYESNSAPPKEMMNNNHLRKTLLDTSQLKQHIQTVLRKEPRTKEENPLLVQFLEELRDMGTDVIIFNVPYFDELELKMDSLRKDRKYTDFKRFCITRYGAEFWDVSRPFSFKDFYDESHMNAKGEKLLTDWFVKRIGEHIESKNR